MSTRNEGLLFFATLLVCSWIVLGQSRGGNWPTFGGDAQRSGWEGTDTAITPDSVREFQLLWKIKLETQPRGMRSVMPPVILGRLISYRGFRELAFVATNADIVYAIDADLGTIFWLKHLEYSTREPQVMSSSWRCPGGLTAMPTMPVPAARGGAARGGPAPVQTAQRGSAFIGGPASVYALSSDGRLHRLNTSTGDDMTQPVSVLPANARATSLNITDNVIYTVTSHECNGAPNAVWAIDLAVDPLKVRSFGLKSGTAWTLGGPIIGTDGVYVQTADGQARDVSSDSSNSLLLLTPRELALKNSFAREREVESPNGGDIAHVPSPVVFPYNNRELIVTACSTGQLCLLDPAAAGDSDRSSPLLYRTGSIFQPTRNPSNSVDRGIWGSISSWQDSDGSRWIAAPVMGPPHADLKAVTNGTISNGFIVAFKLHEADGRFTLAPGWISRDMASPLPPVIANGVVFAVSAGEVTRQVNRTSEDVTTVEERPKAGTRAILYALEARTGRELYSSRNLVSGPASLTGITVSNGRVYFGGVDGSLYAFGKPMER